MKKILILTSLFYPSIKGGGPIQSIQNLINHLSETFNIYLLTSDRDLNDSIPFKNININEWVNYNNIKVKYINSKKLSFSYYKKLYESLNFDVIYVNSFFNYKFSILPLLTFKLLKYKNNTELIVSPRGQFNEGALGIKKIKKTIFLFVSKITRVHSNIKWHATSIEEKEQISSKFPNFKSINVITNLSSNFKNTFYESKPTKNVGELELIYIARIHPIKNLLVVLEALRELSGTEGKIILDVYGPIENLNYWKLCKEVISNLTGNIQVHYRGIAERDKIYNLLSSKHFSVLVSESENFGHSIIESLQTSTPVIIGPNTPWKDLEFEKAGFILNQIEPIHLKDIIRNCQMMNNIKYLEYSNNAFIYSKRKVDNSKLINEYVKMFSI